MQRNMIELNRMLLAIWYLTDLEMSDEGQTTQSS